MAVTPTYPGVYISETASVPHFVTPAPTNLTAFIGSFPKGPTDKAVFVTSRPEFQANFGNLTATSSLAALGVVQFFLNGGIGAWIVRVAPDGVEFAKGTIAPALASDSVLNLQASSQGMWAEGLQISFEQSEPLSNPRPAHCSLVVCPAASTASPPPKTPPPLETVPNLRVIQDDGVTPVPAAQLAAQINSLSGYVTAKAAPQQSPLGSAMSSTVLGGASDGEGWTDAMFASAVETQLQPPGTSLDSIAPAVFNLMCIPELSLLETAQQQTVFNSAQDFCAARQAFFLLDPPPPEAADLDAAVKIPPLGDPETPGQGLLETWAMEFLGPDNYAGATFYPWVEITDPVTALPRLVPPSGTIAGVFAATDTSRGVWKAPAGTEAALQGVSALGDLTLTDEINGALNVIGINCLRTFPLYGSITWGSRTLAGADVLQSAFKYIPVRRLASFIEQSLQQSLRWAVFEPNAAPLWSSLSLEVTAFMAGLYGAGAFAGASAAQAYSVVCDGTTTQLADQLNGVVNVNVSFAPVKPAEFVVLNIEIVAAAAAS